MERFAEAGADVITVHQEACVHLHRVLAQIREAGAAAGVALNPATPIETLAEARHYCDLVLVMSVNPGFGGQEFIPTSAGQAARRARLPAGDVALEVDGGVSRRQRRRAGRGRRQPPRRRLQRVRRRRPGRRLSRQAAPS